MNENEILDPAPLEQSAAPDDAAAPEVAPVASPSPIPAAPAAPVAPSDLVRSQGGVTQKAYGLDLDGAPSLWPLLLGPVGIGLREAGRIKRGYVDPFINNEVQPRLNEALNTPFSNPMTNVNGAPPTSIAQDIKTLGSALGSAASAATGQTPEQGAAGGEALAEYLTKSSLSAYIGGAPLDGLDDATKLRALNELEDLNKHPVLAHAIRKSAAPMIIKLADAALTENADTAAAYQEALMREASLLPLYLIGPSKMAVLEGQGIGLALARGAATGVKSAAPTSLATTVDVDEQGVRKEVPQDLPSTVVAGALTGGAIEGGVGAAQAVGRAVKGVGDDVGKAVAAGIDDFAGELKAPVREEMPFFESTPVVIGLTSDALESLAGGTHQSAAEAAKAADAWDLAHSPDDFSPAARNRAAELAAVRAGASSGALKRGAYKEVPRTDTAFKPNMATLNMEGEIPVVRAVQVDAQGVKRGMTIPLTGPEAIAEVQGLSKRWGMGPIVLQDAIFSGHANVAPFLPGRKAAEQLPAAIRTGTAAASPRAQLRQQVQKNLSDVEVPAAVKREPGFMIMSTTGSNPGAWQLHQLNDPVARAESLAERGLHEVTLPSGETRLGFVRHVDEKGNATVLAPAHEEGLPNSLMFDVEIPRSKVREVPKERIYELGSIEPEALKAERELYKKAVPVASVDELLQTFEKFATKDPETMDLINRYTQRKADKVLKGSIEQGGVVLRNENVSVDLDAKARVRQMLATQGLNSSLVDHLVHVANKRRAGIKPTELEMRLLTEEWRRAEKAVRSGQLGTVEKSALPEPSLASAAPDSDIPGQSLVPDDQVILATGETGSMVALTQDTAVIRVNGALKSVHPDEIVAQAAPEVTAASGADAPAAPPKLPPPPVTGVPPAPIPPANINTTAVLQREFMSNWNKAHNFLMPAYSRGPQDVAQWALTMSSVKSLEQTTRADVYNRLNKTFGPRTLEFNEALNHYINGRTDLPAQEQLLNKFPEVSLPALAYADRLKLQSQILEQKALQLGMLTTEAADRLDPVHLTNSYLRWMNGPGEWAKIASKNQALEARVISRIIKEGDYAQGLTPMQKAAMTKEDIAYKARAFYDELIGLNDKSHAAVKANMGSASKSLMERNIELPPEYIEAMGGITDPAANMAITIARQESLVAQGTTFRDVANSKWSSAGDAPQPDVPGWGSWHLVQGQKYGLLNGRYVHPQVWEGISSAAEMPARVHTFAHSLLDTIKRNRTLYNPGAWGTNVMGNVQGSILAGGIDPILRPIDSGIQFANALRLIAGNARADITSVEGRMLSRARSLGMFTPGLAGSEMGMLRDFEKAVTSQQLRMGKTFSVMDAMKKLASLGTDAVSGFSQRLGAVYDGVDQAFKMANWLSLRNMGLKNPARFLGSQFDSMLPPARLEELVEREAARRVAVSFPMPHAPSAAAAKLRSVGSGAIGAANPFMTMQLEEMRIHANIAARLKGQGGEDGAEFAGRMIRYALFGSAMTATLAGIRRDNGISDEEVMLSKASMSQSAQQYKPGLLPMFWRDPTTGNPRFVDLTSGISVLRLMQGNSSEENLVDRVFYNALKTPVAGSPAEAWLDQTMRRGGFDAAPEGYTPMASPTQLRGAKGMAEALLQTTGPGFATSVPKALNQAGLYGVPPKDPYQRLSVPEGVANALGAKITPGGNPGYGPGGKARELQFKERDARKAEARSYSLPVGEQPGIRSGGMQNSKEDVQRNAAADRERAVKNSEKQRELLRKAGK